MNWRLLDIRVGRANRRQTVLAFFCLIIIGLVLNLFKDSIDIGFIIAGNIILIYCALLMTIRRTRDKGQSGTSLGLAILFIKRDALFSLKDIVTSPFVTAINMLGLLIRPTDTFYKGNRDENKYGSEPQGIDFNTMVSGPLEELDEDFHYDAFDEEDLRNNNRNKGKDE